MILILAAPVHVSSCHHQHWSSGPSRSSAEGIAATQALQHLRAYGIPDPVRSSSDYSQAFPFPENLVPYLRFASMQLGPNNNTMHHATYTCQLLPRYLSSAILTSAVPVCDVVVGSGSGTAKGTVLPSAMPPHRRYNSSGHMGCLRFRTRVLLQFQSASDNSQAEMVNNISYHLLAILFWCTVRLKQRNVETNFILGQKHVASYERYHTRCKSLTWLTLLVPELGIFPPIFTSRQILHAQLARLPAVPHHPVMVISETTAPASTPQAEAHATCAARRLKPRSRPSSLLITNNLAPIR